MSGNLRLRVDFQIDPQHKSNVLSHGFSTKVKNCCLIGFAPNNNFDGLQQKPMEE